jgi:hypothetical protein
VSQYDCSVLLALASPSAQGVPVPPLRRTKFVYKLGLLLFLLMSDLTPSFAASTYYRRVAVDHTRVPSDQSSFPVYVATTLNTAHVSNSSGYDVRPYSNSACSAALPYELESYDNSTGVIQLWVTAATLSSSVDTVFYLCYGDASLNTDGSMTSAWDGHFKGVWHISNGVTPGLDSTSSRLNLTNHGVTTVPGQIGKAGNFVRSSSQYLTRSSPTLSANPVTVSAWINPSRIWDGTGQFPWIVGVGYDGTNYQLGLYMADSNGNIKWNSYAGTFHGVATTGGLTANAWYYMVGVFDGSNYKLYAYGVGSGAMSGSPFTSTDATAPNPTAIDLDIGAIYSVGGDGYFWDGQIDEVRISDVARNADWITTEWNNQSSVGTFETIGTETSIAVLAAGAIGVQFMLDGVNLGSEVTSAPYSVSWNSTLVATGVHTLTAVARDEAGNTTTSAGINIMVDNVAPTVSITAPANLAPLSGTSVAVTAAASDNVGVVGVQFKLDGANLGAEVTSAPYSIIWDSTTAANGSHALTAVARDAAGNQTTSASVSVTTSNLTINKITDSAPGLSPAFIQVGTGPFSLRVNGQGFTADSVVQVAQINLQTTFNNANTLIAAVPASLVKTTGALPLVVMDGSRTSNSMFLTTTYRGDTNADGNVNIIDALSTARSGGQLVQPALPVALADVNLDDVVSISDALVLALLAGGTIPNFSTPAISTTSITGSANAGDTITISGRGFSSNAADNVVVFSKSGGGFVWVPVTAVSGDASSGKTLTVTIPLNAASGPIFVKRKDLGLPGEPFTISISGSTIPLYISSVVPAVELIPGVSSITITGSGFDPIPTNNVVMFSGAGGTVSGTVTAASPNTLTVMVPAFVQSGFLSVTAGNVTSNAKSVMTTAGATVPSINQVHYGEYPGEPMVIEGTGFDVSVPSNNQTLFSDSNGNDLPANVIAAGRTELIVLVPPGAVSGHLRVKTGTGVNAMTSNDFPLQLPN